MSLTPDDAKDQQTASGEDGLSAAEDGLPAEPVRNKAALWVPRIGTIGLLGLLSFRQVYQYVPGSAHGALALMIPLFGENLPDRAHAIGVVQAMASPLLIWTMEGYRTSGRWGRFLLSWISGIAIQLIGIHNVALLYFLTSIVGDIRPLRLHITKNSEAKPSYSFYLYDDSRTAIDADAATAALPATLLGHVLPGVLMTTLNLTFSAISSSSFNASVCLAFMISPVTVSSLTLAISKGIKWFRRRNLSTSQLPVEQSKAVPNEQLGSSVHAVNTACAAMFAVQASQYLLTTAKFLLPSNVSAIRDRRYTLPQGYFWDDPLPVFKLSTIAFGLYTVWDLRTKGYITTREAIWAALTFGLGHGIVGIGADYVGLWWWREGVLERAGHYSRAPVLHIGDYTI